MISKQSIAFLSLKIDSECVLANSADSNEIPHLRLQKNHFRSFQSTKQFNHLFISCPHGISINAVCATSKCSEQPAHTHSLIRASASRWNIL